ncbi:hypothetical protein IWZ03DRAFT_167655 [Phyllosticta citriasiana]|uniref:Transmembrane protein n=1 Tax=Phyllosticta citriasiana TaxID=595635 RepID=A0ABR1KRX5_9PEZI
MNKKRLIPPCFSLLSPFPQPQVTTAKVLVLLPRISTGALVRFFFTGQGKERRAKHMKRNWVRVAGVAGQTGAGQVRAHGRLGKQSGFPIFFFLFSFSFLFCLFFFFFPGLASGGVFSNFVVSQHLMWCRRGASGTLGSGSGYWVWEMRERGVVSGCGS